MQVSHKKYISLEQAGEILGVHPRTVRRLISAGEISGYTLGKRILRVDQAEVEAVLRQIPTGGAA